MPISFNQCDVHMYLSWYWCLVFWKKRLNWRQLEVGGELARSCCFRRCACCVGDADVPFFTGPLLVEVTCGAEDDSKFLCLESWPFHFSIDQDMDFHEFNSRRIATPLVVPVCFICIWVWSLLDTFAWCLTDGGAESLPCRACLQALVARALR